MNITRRDLIRCPVHGIPDCSPLLNGCSIPNRLNAAYEHGLSQGAAEIIERVEEVLTGGYANSKHVSGYAVVRVVDVRDVLTPAEPQVVR